MTEPTSAGRRYLATVGALVERIEREEWPNLRIAAALFADTLARGDTIHAFGSGHSHMLAEELFYRAGGLVRVRPILFEGLMLYPSATLSTRLERLPALAEALVAEHGVAAGDVVVIASNSGSNAVASRVAQCVREAGAVVVAITSLRHATSAEARANDLPRLHELADVVIDNGGAVGDAAVRIDGFEPRVAATSTVVGAAILNAIVAETVALLVERGTPPDIYTSSNTEGGDEANLRYLPRSGGRP
jgi:uncharacterized phosphosugar-binding protein